MRVKCVHCFQSFDVANKKILAEADRLKAKRAGKQVVDQPGSPEVDGNIFPSSAQCAGPKRGTNNGPNAIAD